MRRTLALLLWSASAALTPAQIVHGQVEGVGFTTNVGPVIREGQWFPVVVSLQCHGSELFSGELRLLVTDQDGDLVAYVQPQVSVGGESGRPRRFWCYAVANVANDVPADVEVVGTKGVLVARLPLPAQPIQRLLSDDLLVLDVSDPELVGLGVLETLAWSPGQRTNGQRTYYRNVVTARLPAEQLPDRWFGLEAVDVIFWDRPDPQVLSLAQRDALIEWVHNGGQLVLGIGTSWPTLRKSDLAELLPLRPEGEVVEVQRLEVFARNFLPPSALGREFRPPIAVTTAAPTPDAIRALGDFGPTGPLSLITMRQIGAGRVSATAASLRDLLRETPDREKFFTALLDLSRYEKSFLEREAELARFGGRLPVFVYDEAVKPIALASETLIRSTLAGLFTSGYMLLATVVSWVWLRRKRLTHLSWLVFAGFALIGSALSLGMVAALRSCSRGVESLCVLDLLADETTARGVCFFGYGSSTRQRVELTLPGEGNFLRPLAGSPRGSGKYVTPARYAGLPTRAMLSDVLLRATLKQFDGYWMGSLDGTIRGDLVVSRADGRLTPGSWIANDLPDDLAGGYLLFIDPRQDQAGVPCRAANLTTLYELPEALGGEPDLTVVPPAMNILVVRVPPLAAGAAARELGTPEYRALDQQLSIWARRGGTLRRSERPDLNNLWRLQQSWTKDNLFSSLQRSVSGPVSAWLLASTRNYYLHNANGDLNAIGPPLSFDNLPDVDVSHWLLRGQAVLLAWSARPAPPRLHRDGQPLEVSRGLTIYRVLLPLRYEGLPPGWGKTR